METRQQELYSNVLSGTVVDWGDVGPEEHWVNSHKGAQGLDKATACSSREDVGVRNSRGEEWEQTPLKRGGLAEKTVLSGGHWGQPSPAGEAGYKSYHPVEEEWGQSCEDWAMATTWDMQLDPTVSGHLRTGLLDSEPLNEADEDLASEDNHNIILTEEEREEIQQELAKLEEEIVTLRQVLSSKEKQHAELKQKLGVTPLSEMRNNFSRGWHEMQSSTAYKKTSETFTTAGQKTTAAFSTLGTAIGRKLGDMSMFGLELLYPRRSNSIGYSIRHSMSMPTMRNSPSFKSFEEVVENTVSTIKTKVGGQGTGGSFEEVLSSAAHASTQDTPTNNLTDSSEMPC